MEHSENMASIATALAKAQAEMTDATFDSTNPHFGKGYASLSAINAIAKTLSKHGIAYVQGASMDERRSVVVTTMLVHSSGEWFKSVLALKPERDTPQGCGAVLTYARRYSLSAMCGISSADSDGEEVSQPVQPSTRKAPPARQKPPTPAPTQVASPAAVAPPQERRPCTKTQREQIVILANRFSASDPKFAAKFAARVVALVASGKIEDLSDVEAMALLAQLTAKLRTELDATAKVAANKSIPPIYTAKEREEMLAFITTAPLGEFEFEQAGRKAGIEPGVLLAEVSDVHLCAMKVAVTDAVDRGMK